MVSSPRKKRTVIIYITFRAEGGLKRDCSLGANKANATLQKMCEGRKKHKINVKVIFFYIKLSRAERLFSPISKAIPPASGVPLT